MASIVCSCRPIARQQQHCRNSMLPTQFQAAVRSPRLAPLFYRHYASKKTLERKAANQRHPRQPSPAAPARQDVHKPKSTGSSSPATTDAPNAVHHTKATPAQPTLRTPPRYLPAMTAYAQTLASRATPTVLYSSPPSNSLPVTTTTVSTFCFAYGTYHLYTNFVLPQPSGLWWGIPYAMGGVSLLMLALGFWVRGSGRALVGRIEAVPRSLLRSDSDKLATSSGARDAAHDDGILLRVTQKTSLPSFMRLGRPPRSVLAAPESCRLSSRLAQAQAHGAYSPMHDRHITVQGQRTRVSARDYAALEDGQRAEAKGPFAIFGGMLSAGLAGFGRIVTREGLLPLDVEVLEQRRGGEWKAGRKMRWKVDVSEGAFIGDGGLERLVQIK